MRLLIILGSLPCLLSLLGIGHAAAAIATFDELLGSLSNLGYSKTATSASALNDTTTVGASGAGSLCIRTVRSPGSVDVLFISGLSTNHYRRSVIFSASSYPASRARKGPPLTTNKKPHTGPTSKQRPSQPAAYSHGPPPMLQPRYFLPSSSTARSRSKAVAMPALRVHRTSKAASPSIWPTSTRYRCRRIGP